ncbi:hypothetical protein GCM10023085_44650 [Actinomadura viridis]|uniref:RNA binding protein YcfA (HicA-like mRNA interferase family) n=1 Tax=Actinomadura viridis TaxID=58110 RepID=A0A931DI89_9ACTN|nr:type II toxin-antitoxin system HicA family toxin [Actinomadura viridis]MBG6089827.1 putative RNA binding protein YcfA (HicA-like mRNA interferase family) [Actinomadura viridis]
MPKGMKRREVIRALKENGCELDRNASRGPHEKWVCGCGKHIVIIPRHRMISPGVVGDTEKRLECLAEGWLH